ncbi:hypothetical protein [Streptomyces sp. AC495_CC817]|uniref:hypothetical protein n=1 Tax=Streptomyces sp. AC495_CC817 TaxID=2823900 RepID=UPI001C25346A|nr:hypothetical protein [Streptomyces sp. AC495_CC817]
MIVLRWVTGLLAVEALVCLFFTERGALSTALAGVFFLLFLIFCGTLRTPTRKAHNVSDRHRP